MSARDSVDFSDFADYVDAGAAGLEAFRDVLVAHRDRIVDEPAPTFDVIVELLELCIAGARELEPERPPARCSWEAG